MDALRGPWWQWTIEEATTSSSSTAWSSSSDDSDDVSMARLEDAANEDEAPPAPLSHAEVARITSAYRLPAPAQPTRSEDAHGLHHDGWHGAHWMRAAAVGRDDTLWLRAVDALHDEVQQKVWNPPPAYLQGCALCAGGGWAAWHPQFQFASAIEYGHTACAAAALRADVGTPPGIVLDFSSVRDTLTSARSQPGLASLVVWAWWHSLQLPVPASLPVHHHVDLLTLAAHRKAWHVLPHLLHAVSTIHPAWPAQSPASRIALFRALMQAVLREDAERSETALQLPSAAANNSSSVAPQMMTSYRRPIRSPAADALLCCLSLEAHADTRGVPREHRFLQMGDVTLAAHVIGAWRVWESLVRGGVARRHGGMMDAELDAWRRHRRLVTWQRRGAALAAWEAALLPPPPRGAAGRAHKRTARSRPCLDDGVERASKRGRHDG